MFPEQIFNEECTIVPEINMEVIRHVDLGERVICVYCNINGFTAKRITQEINGKMVNEIPVWNLGNRVVANWFASLLETKYNSAMDHKTIVIHHDIV